MTMTVYFLKAVSHHCNRALIDPGPVPIPEYGVVRCARQPALATLPAMRSEKVCDRSQHVRHATDQVAAAITIIVDGILQIRRRKELRLTNLACPAAAQLRRAHVAALDDL